MSPPAPHVFFVQGIVCVTFARFVGGFMGGFSAKMHVECALFLMCDMGKGAR
jgi:hypothetical protein